MEQSVDEGQKKSDIKDSLKVVLVGVGTMNPGIAVDYLLAGHKVTLVGRETSKIEAGLNRAKAALQFLVTEKVVKESSISALGLRLKGKVLLANFKAVPELAEADLIVESVSEDLTVKQNLFLELEKVISPDTLLLSNTSSLSISDISAPLAFPQRVAGTHYMNPAYLMPLVEVTPGLKTDPAVIDRINSLIKNMGKTPIAVKKERPGLIWNRLQLALIRECLYLLEEGVAGIEDLDLVVEKGLARRWSFIGPFKTSDLGGQDVFLTIAKYLFPDLAGNTCPPEFWSEMVSRGETGLKSGKGFYNWNSETAANLISQRDAYLLKLLQRDKKE